jgi:signal transduction histidine kinase
MSRGGLLAAAAGGARERVLASAAPLVEEGRPAAVAKQRLRGPVVEADPMADGHTEDLSFWLHLQPATVVLCTLVVIAFGVSAFVDTPPHYHQLLVLALTASLAVLVVVSLQRQHRAVAQLRAREEQLAGQKALLQSTLENMGEGLSVFDREGHLIAWNTRFASLLKLPIDLSHATLEEILRHQAERGDFGALDDPAREARERTKRFYHDLPSVSERTTMGGRVLQIRRRAMPGGAVVSVYSDITERKAAETKMEQARVQAELANRAKGNFLANMSHELRTPLNAIIGFSEVLSNQILGPVTDERQLEYIKDIHSSGLLLLSIINDVLDMSKIEAGKLELARERVAVQVVIAEAVRMVSERARGRKVRVITALPPGDLAIWGDERAIKQIMLNLLSNAVKFSHEGGRVTIRGFLSGNEHLVIEVEDKGIGMSAEEIERALQPFGQAKAATTRTHGGTGLGLPIAKGLVEAHGGTLVVESSPDQGALVRIVLPTSADPALASNALLRPLSAGSPDQRAVA